MKTKAAILYEINAPLIIQDIDLPELTVGQVLVKMHASGVCRSQLNEVKGLKGADKFLPHLLGHEGAGEIFQIGPKVTKVKRGDFVILSWIKGNGLDVSNSRYNFNKQIINSGPIATFSDYVVVSENRVTKIKDKIPADRAALLGCCIPTGVGITLHKLQLKPDSTLAIFGVGGIGLSVVLGAKMQQVVTIIAVDVNQKALAFAKKIGATYTIHFNVNNVAAEIRSICKNGVDFVVEASGNKLAMEKTLQIVNDHGLVVIAGNIGHRDTIRINPFDLIKGKTILGTWGGETNPDIDFPLYAKAYIAGKLNLDALVARRVRLEEINTVLTEMAEYQHAGRTIIDFSNN